MTISIDVILWILSGVMALIIGLIGVLYSNMRERINRVEAKQDNACGDLETKLQARITDVDRYSRHGIRDLNNGIQQLTQLVVMRRTDTAFNRRATDIKDDAAK